MPVTFHDREQAFEAKFVHDEEFRFLVSARRDKLFARWVAAELAMPREEGEALVKAVLAIPNGPGHDQALLQHVTAAASTHDGVTMSGDLTSVLDRCGLQARKELIEAPPRHPGAP
jgi:hypothetical protein